MRIRILGCSGGIGANLRTSCLLVDEDILVDCGSGAGDLTLEQMVSIETVFLTHSHLDHVAFLPMLADIPARKNSLTVYALEETIAILKRDILNFRIWPDYSRLPTPENPYILFRPIFPGQCVETAQRKITAIPAKHSVAATGYLLQGAEGSFAFSGDSTFSAGFWDCLNATESLRYLLIEATFLNKNADRAEISGHMTPELLCRGFNRLSRKVTILIAHMEPGNEKETMQEILDICPQFRPEKAERGQLFEL